MKKDFRYDIAVLRVLSIIIVVFFHAYGMCYANHFPEYIAQAYREKYEMFNQSYLINIAMPLFVVISGYLFGLQLSNNRFQSFWELIANKFKRLIIPFFVFSLIFMLTTESFSLSVFYTWSYAHLWFLPMLFWCFIISFFLKNILLHKSYLFSILILIILIVISLPDKFAPFLIGLYSVSKWIYWFVLGIVLWRFNDNIVYASKRYPYIFYITLSALYVIFGILLYSEYGITTIQGIISSTAAIIILITTCQNIKWHKISNGTNKIFQLLLKVSSCSFGIYIFHYWIEGFMISSTAQRLLNLPEFAYKHIYIFPFLFSAIAFVISFLLSYLLQKTKIGKYLIG